VALALGLPYGTELEYADDVTLTRGLAHEKIPTLCIERKPAMLYWEL